MNIGEALKHEWHAFERHHDQPAPDQETAMTTPPVQQLSRIADARAAIARADQRLAEVGANALAEAIADSGLGATASPEEIGLVLAVIRAIEQGVDQHPAGNFFKGPGLPVAGSFSGPDTTTATAAAPQFMPAPVTDAPQVSS